MKVKFFTHPDTAQNVKEYFAKYAIEVAIFEDNKDLQYIEIYFPDSFTLDDVALRMLHAGTNNGYANSINAFNDYKPTQFKS
jgi:hypothetical protein